MPATDGEIERTPVGNVRVDPKGSPAKRVKIPAWILSIASHAGLVAVLLLSLRTMPRGANVKPDRPAGIVLANRTAEHIEYFEDENDFIEKLVDVAAPISSNLPLPVEDDLPTTMADVLPATSSPGASLVTPGDLLPDATGFTTGRPSPKRLGRSVQTSVFGVTGIGNTFVYVFDRSGSMGDFNGRPLAAAKSELLASLNELDDVHQFQIIFYNNQPTIFNPNSQSPSMWWANDRGKTLARRFVASFTAVGGTKHMAALQMALGMQPDILFFLTDANEPQLSRPELEKIRRLNSGVTSIHTIQFGYGPDSEREHFLKRLAKENQGRHTYIDISQLGNRKP